ncbi:MAG: hypothetical protein ACXWAX_00740 [Chthoniobacterales bacterium]
MSALYQYFGAFFTNWFLYMTAGPFLADEVFKRAFPKWRESAGKHFPARTRRRIEVAFIIFGVFWAGFAAFNEEHAARERAEAAARSPVPTPIPFQVTETDTVARTQLEAANRKIDALEAQLKEAQKGSDAARESAFQAEIATRPKSIKERLRECLDAIDPHITQELISRPQIVCRIDVEVSKLKPLQKLAAEPSARDLIEMKSVSGLTGMQMGEVEIGTKTVEFVVQGDLMR